MAQRSSARSPSAPRALAPAPPPVPAVPRSLPSDNALAVRQQQGAVVVAANGAANHGYGSSSQALAVRKPLGIATSGGQLRKLLEGTGYKVDKSVDGAEKLDILVWMSNQLKENVEKRRRMKLELAELYTFLIRESMAPKKNDAKSTINELLALRRRELARLDYTRASAQEAEDHNFQLALADMSAEEVDNCFALVPYQDPVETAKASRACVLM
eukprot:TRINITY_DN39715_c0_g1_i1.p2 TRINITY_DN39715_c0_g1~~TRINITY_DN39715_c0_g1_i1.p2  ORF type:complete len:214 (+),score=65.55 TRINITY_DN39715_c0_g1_i1:281-922(+)